MNPTNKTDRTPCQVEHDFTLVLSGVSQLTPEQESALFESGCDDATISVRAGRVYVTFSRLSDSTKSAILSAIHDVRSAGIHADVLRVDICNLVTQSEIARRIGRSRQQVHQFISGIRGPGRFPPPVCNISDDSPLWYWCEVSYWLWENNMIKEDVVREAEEIDVINSVLELKHQKQIKPDLAEEIIGSLWAQYAE